MTGKWCGWAADLPADIKANTRVVAFVLGDASDPDGLVTYGKKKLAKRGAMSIRTWQRATDELEAKGWITKHKNAVETIKTRDGKTVYLKGDERPNLYVLNAKPVPEGDRRVQLETILARRRAWTAPPEGGDTSDQTEVDRGDTSDRKGGDTSDGETPDRGVTGGHQSPLNPPTEGSPFVSPSQSEASGDCDQVQQALPGTQQTAPHERFCRFFYEQMQPVRSLEELRVSASWPKAWDAASRALLEKHTNQDLAAWVRHAFGGRCYLGGSIDSPLSLMRLIEHVQRDYDSKAAEDNRKQGRAGSTPQGVDLALNIARMASHKPGATANPQIEAGAI